MTPLLAPVTVALIRSSRAFLNSGLALDGRRGLLARLDQLGVGHRIVPIEVTRNGAVERCEEAEATRLSDDDAMVRTKLDSIDEYFRIPANVPLENMCARRDFPSPSNAGRSAMGASPVLSSAGARVVTTSSDGAARLWDPATGELLCLIRYRAGVAAASYSADGSRLVVIERDNTVITGLDNTARLWDSVAGKRGYLARA